MISLPPNKGKLLVAEPSIIGDISFNRSVVLLADHNTEGSIGFILNKLLDFNLSELVPGVEKDFKIYNGGPVEQDNLYFIHKVPDLIPGSIEIDKGIFWGGNFEVVKSLIANNLIFEEDIKFFLGYSGWDTNQLDTELNANAWIVIENKDNKNILQKNSTDFWKVKMQELGGEYLIWSNAPENPSYN
ncbi:YqgE/AlgH family protein [Mesonia phycicola]|uniref:YqgE/AlgH family protein n=1 Tax=Mesonia phycicola TaxID=579105 RepID=UPI000932A13E|nr:YqgE/AlgH family protein [Mesonia phycicola]